MKAVVYKGKGKIALENRPVPKIQDDRDAIIKVTLTTICSSDIHINDLFQRYTYQTRRSAACRPRNDPGT